MRSVKTAKRPKPSANWAQRWIRQLPMRTVLFAGLSLTTVGVLAGLGWHAANSGVVNRLLIAGEAGFREISIRTGLAVRDVMVSGRDRTARAELLRAIGIKAGDPILTVDLAGAHLRIASLAWVKQVRVERRLPDTVFVSLVEREPMALWQRNGKLHLIDRDGGVIPSAEVEKFSDLPIVIGQDAPPRTRDVLAMLSREPDLRQRVRAVTWVGERRWDVRVDDRINVQLPEQAPFEAWAQLARMEREHGVLRRDVIAIDMRLRDQLVVRVAPETAARLRRRGRDT
ncbi:MAG: FtsQ-type POTRA domain-containing protein [Proteobacteria bacterium]|nr:FtsQ-type POTRA domain-containing protein [Pseudomonadota bacterium]